MNWKIRIKNPIFIAQMILAIMTPIMAYAGITASDLTSWNALGELLLSALANPYVIGLVAVSLWNAINDPTTKGLTDSIHAKNKTEL